MNDRRVERAVAEALKEIESLADPLPSEDYREFLGTLLEEISIMAHAAEGDARRKGNL